jgi:hypothetical protein
MNVTLSKIFVTQVGETYAELVKSKFVDWKSNSNIESFYFGKDGGNLGSNYVRHVHFYPGDQQAREKWALNFKNNRKRVSDAYLYYIHDGNNNYLILSLNEPGHSTLSDKKMMLQFENIASFFIIHGNDGF